VQKSFFVRSVRELFALRRDSTHPNQLLVSSCRLSTASDVPAAGVPTFATLAAKPWSQSVDSSSLTHGKGLLFNIFPSGLKTETSYLRASPTFHLSSHFNRTNANCNRAFLAVAWVPASVLSAT